MPINFTDQALSKAIVPIQLGFAGRFQEQWDGHFSQITDIRALVERDRWKILWAGYAFRDAEAAVPNTQPDQLPWAFAEASMMMTDHMHDFCGGVIGSSASVRTTSHASTYSRWESPANSRLFRLSPKRYNEARFFIPGETIPILTEALRIERPITRSEVTAILSRSLVFWAMSYLYGIGKRGIVCMDRAARHNSYSRDVFSYADEITWITRAPLWTDRTALQQNPETELEATPTTPRTYQFYQIGPYFARQQPVIAKCDHGATWINHNSGNPVGPVQLFFTTAKDFKSREQYTDEDYASEYDPERDEYVPKVVPIPDDGKVEIPEWFSKPAQTTQYVRSFPRRIFSN